MSSKFRWSIYLAILSAGKLHTGIIENNLSINEDFKRILEQLKNWAKGMTRFHLENTTVEEKYSLFSDPS